MRISCCCGGGDWRLFVLGTFCSHDPKDFCSLRTIVRFLGVRGEMRTGRGLVRLGRLWVRKRVYAYVCVCMCVCVCMHLLRESFRMETLKNLHKKHASAEYISSMHQQHASSSSCISSMQHASCGTTPTSSYLAGIGGVRERTIRPTKSGKLRPVNGGLVVHIS